MRWVPRERREVNNRRSNGGREVEAQRAYCTAALAHSVADLGRGLAQPLELRLLSGAFVLVLTQIHGPCLRIRRAQLHDRDGVGKLVHRPLGGHKALVEHLRLEPCQVGAAGQQVDCAAHLREQVCQLRMALWALAPVHVDQRMCEAVLQRQQSLCTRDEGGGSGGGLGPTKGRAVRLELESAHLLLRGTFVRRCRRLRQWGREGTR
jgi:hypothetical protein